MLYSDFNKNYGILNMLNALMAEGIVDSKVQQVTELFRTVDNLRRTLETDVSERRARFTQQKCCLLHEVKNALTGILSCAEVLGIDELAPDEKQEFLEVIGYEIERVVGMTGDFRNCVDGHLKPLQLQILSVKTFIQQISPLIKSYLANRNISFHLDLQYTEEFQIDVKKMKQVFLNILYNACDAMPDEGKLTISSQLCNDMIQFEFTDTGCGISSELQAQFFEPLVTEGKSHGTGLGMAIVKDILNEHHAYIEVESIITKGTTIRILLPCRQSC